MAEDLIRRKDALDLMCQCCKVKFPCASSCDDYLKLLRVPTADVQPITQSSWWAEHGNDIECKGKPKYYFCDKCKYKNAEKTKFCPNCGAKMEGDK